jgi:hypothetical protein
MAARIADERPPRMATASSRAAGASLAPNLARYAGFW